jgi:hypothetical protein
VCLAASILVTFIASFAMSVWTIQYLFVVPLYGLFRIFFHRRYFYYNRRHPVLSPWRVWPPKAWWRRLWYWIDEVPSW